MASAASTDPRDLELTRHRKSAPSQVAGRIVLTLVLIGGVAAILLAGTLLDGDQRIAVVELTIVALLAVLPGWLYLEFVVHRGPGLYDEYVINLFRLHIDEYRNLPAPPQHTSYFPVWQSEHDQLRTNTTDNLYRSKFEAVYGPASVSTKELIGRGDAWYDLGRTFGPIVLATIVLCLGWTLTFQPGLLVDLVEGRSPLAGRPEIPTGALQFGFIGAYVFILQDLVRRYFRDDLKPGAYVSAIVRVIVTALIVLALHVVWNPSWRVELVAVAFLIGFFPETGLQLLLTSVSRPIARLFPSIKADHPLHKIDGLSIWYEARLLEEGIEDIENLVTANLVDVMLRTRVPLNRLIDWLDQGFLYLRLTDDDRAAALLRLGIRTATDLQAVWTRGAKDPLLRLAIGRALGADEELAATAGGAILAAFDGEPSYWHVQQYRKHEWLLRDERRQQVGTRDLSGSRDPVHLR